MRQHAVNAVFWCVVSVCGGCAVGPDYVPPCPPELQPSYQSWDTTEAAPADLAYWWTYFEDPTLDQLITRAWQQNLDLKASATRIVQARAQRAVVRGGLFPQMDATGEHDYRRFSSNANPFVTRRTQQGSFEVFSTGFDATWELDLFGKVQRAVEAADATIGVQVEDSRDVLVTLLADVGLNYLTIRLVQERLTIAHANLAAQRQTLEMVLRRHAAGLVGQLDVAQAESNVHTTASSIPVLEEELQVAFNRLAILLGHSPDQGLSSWVGDGPMPEDPRQLPLAVPADLIRRRPDVRRAEREVAVSSARIGVAVADLYPQFTLNGTISVDSRNVSSLFAKPSLVHGVGPSFRWDVLNSGRVRNNIRVQRARHNETIFHYQQTLLLAVEEVENALVGYQRSGERVASLRRAADATSTAALLSSTQYERGLITFQTLLDSERQRLATEEQLAISRGTVLLSLVRTFKAAGGGWEARVPAAPASSPLAEVRATPEPTKCELRRLPASDSSSAVGPGARAMVARSPSQMRLR